MIAFGTGWESQDAINLDLYYLTLVQAVQF